MHERYEKMEVDKVRAKIAELRAKAASDPTFGVQYSKPKKPKAPKKRTLTQAEHQDVNALVRYFVEKNREAEGLRIVMGVKDEAVGADPGGDRQVAGDGPDRARSGADDHGHDGGAGVRPGPEGLQQVPESNEGVGIP